MRELIIARLVWFVIVRPFLKRMVEDSESTMDDTILAEADRAIGELFKLG